MNWAWTASFDQLWRSPTFPMWLILAAAGFFGIILLITLLRAEKSVANGALTVITLLAIGIAVAATMRTFGPGDRAAPGETRSPQQTICSYLPQQSPITASRASRLAWRSLRISYRTGRKAYAFLSRRSEISGGAPIRAGMPMVPIPRVTYAVARPMR